MVLLNVRLKMDRFAFFEKKCILYYIYCMTKEKKLNFIKNHKITKIQQKKHSQLLTSDNDNNIREALKLITNLKTNIYQRIYVLSITERDKWQQFDFISSQNKIETFVRKLEQEIKSIKSKKFNFDKYKVAIYHILKLDKPKFTEEIVKNMYIAKLQNIIYLLSDEADNDLKEVQENKQTNDLRR